MTGRIIVCYLLFVINAIPLASQKETLLQANYAFENGHYQKAISLYTQYNKISRDKEALKNRGLAHFNYNLIDKAIADFTSAKNLGNNDPILYLKMGQSKQFLKSFDEASFFYQKYLELADKNAPYRKMAELEIKNCVFGALENFETAGTLIQSFGDDINSRYDEIYPIQSPTFGNVFYFSSNRNKSDFDIFSYTLSESGLWSKNDISEKPLNNTYHNVALDIDGADINAMLYSEVDTTEETIQFASFDLSGQDIVVKLPTEIFEGAKDISIVNHNMLVFASKKLNGFGGYDIFTVSYKDGAWTTPQNLGAAINSPFDEICPFYSNNLDHFYFSSNRPYCFGGYDIYYCNILNKKLPVNMGYGINSHGDDLHFNLDDAGHMATFSSNRKTGLGGYDLFFAYLQDIKNMGQRDSLVFEYLINPAEEFVQVKNRDDLSALNTKKDKLNSSLENNPIEISPQLEAVKERTSEYTSDVEVTDGISNKTKTKKELEKDLTESKDLVENKTSDSNSIDTGKNPETASENVTDSRAKEDLVAKTNTVITVRKEPTNTNEGVTSQIEEKKNDIVESITETSKEKSETKDQELIAESKELKVKTEESHLDNETNKSNKSSKGKIVDSQRKNEKDVVEIKETQSVSGETIINNSSKEKEGQQSTIDKPKNKTIVKDSKAVNIATKSDEPEENKNIVDDKVNKTGTTVLPPEDSIEPRTNIDVVNNDDKPNQPQSRNSVPSSEKDISIKGEQANDDKIEVSVQENIDSSKNKKAENKLKDQENKNIKNKTAVPKPTSRKPNKLKENKIDALVKDRDFKRVKKSWKTFVQPQTLYYQDRHDLTRGENLIKLNQLIVDEYNKNSTFVLLAHTDDSELGLPEYVQYNTFKRALKVAEYLNESGIDKDRIKIESLANNYPLIKSDIAGEKINSLYASNKRVDVLLYENNTIKEDGVIEDTSIPKYAFDRKYELFRSIREGTYYSIEIASADRIFKNAILRLYTDIYIRRDEFDGKNKYYIGIYTQKEDAELVRDQLLETSSPYAKVVKFTNGKITN